MAEEQPHSPHEKQPAPPKRPPTSVDVARRAGVSQATVVEQVFREVRAFRIYDGPTEVHKWSLAKKVKRDWRARQG